MPARLLLLGRASFMQPLAAALAPHTTEIVESYSDAAAALEARRPDALLLAYHFDGLRPYSIVQHVRAREALSHLPILLVRVMPVGLGTTSEAELDQAYRELGVDDVLDLASDIRAFGREAAMDRLRDCVARLLARR